MGRGVDTGVGVGTGEGARGGTAQADISKMNTHGLARNNITGEYDSHQEHAPSITMEIQGLGWLLLEAGIALGLFVFIVWWTMKR
jgi:hypothetical protein